MMHRPIFFLLVSALLLGACESSTPEDAAKTPPPMAQADSEPETPGESRCTVTPPAEPMACTQQYDPVCGCDGKTYGNACMARGAGVSDFEPGACAEALD